MANYYTKFSVAISLRSDKEVAWARKNVVKFADPEKNADSNGFDWEIQDERREGMPSLWMYTDSGEGDVDAVIAFAQAYLKRWMLDGFFAIEWANDCGQPRLDAYGGGAAFVTVDSVEYVNTSSWLDEKRVDFEIKKK